jgi:hypothetical protein
MEIADMGAREGQRQGKFSEPIGSRRPKQLCDDAVGRFCGEIADEVREGPVRRNAASTRRRAISRTRAAALPSALSVDHALSSVSFKRFRSGPVMASKSVPTRKFCPLVMPSAAPR